jgi:hypothetical protein
LNVATIGLDLNRASLKVLNHAANVIVVAGKEKFQGFSVLPEQQAHFQSGAALENVFPQPPDGNSTVSMRMAEVVGNHLKRGLDAGEIRIAQILERGVKTRA